MFPHELSCAWLGLAKANAPVTAARLNEERKQRCTKERCPKVG
jgi:hypothetical protein